MKLLYFVSSLLLLLNSCHYMKIQGFRSMNSVDVISSEPYFVLEIEEFPNATDRYFGYFIVDNGKIFEADINGVSIFSGSNFKSTNSTMKSKFEYAETGLTVGSQATDVFDAFAPTVKTRLIKLVEAAIKSERGAGSIDGYLVRRGKGPYVDGVSTYLSPAFDENGWKSKITITTVNGYITAANWDPINQEGRGKKETSKMGEYGMQLSWVEHSIPQIYWWQQAEAAERYLLEIQDPVNIKYSNDAGKSDVISGATINVNDFFLAVIKMIERT